MTYQIDRLGSLLQEAARKVQRQFELRTATHGLSAAQWRLLAHLMRQGPSTQVALADLLGVEPISVSRLIDRMEQGGWLRREPHPDDRRARIIVATAKACDAAPGVRTIAETLYAEALTGLGDEERRLFDTALRQVVANMDRMAAPQDATPHPQAETEAQA